MPFHAPYEPLIEPVSPIWINAPHRRVSRLASTAALFCVRLSTDSPYAHFDIYGLATAASAARAKGGVGQATRALHCQSWDVPIQNDRPRLVFPTRADHPKKLRANHRCRSPILGPQPDRPPRPGRRSTVRAEPCLGSLFNGSAYVQRTKDSLLRLCQRNSIGPVTPHQPMSLTATGHPRTIAHAA